MTACVRCGSMLAIGDICVVPRRATRLGVPIALRRLCNRIRNAVFLPGLSLSRWGIHSPAAVSWSAVRWTIIPGLGHLRSGHRRLGIGLLATWIALLFLAVVSIATNAAPWLLAFAVATHATAFISLFAANLNYERYIIRALFGILLFLGLQYCVYAPVTSALGNVHRTVVLPQLPPNDVLASDDGLLYEGAWLRTPPRLGDLVVYDIPARNLGAHIYSREGIGVDRVIGLAGDFLEYQDGVLTRNGAPVPPAELPLLPMSLPNFRFTVPDDHVAIFPSLAAIHTHGNALTDYVARILIEVPEQDVRGRVVFRLRPWSRMGHVR